MSAPCPRYGFSIALELAPGADLGAFEDAFRAFLDGRGLGARPAGRGGRREFVVTSDASQATELDREAVSAWLAARPDVARTASGALVDLSAA